MVVQLERVTALPAGIELVALATAACLLMIEPAVADPARAGTAWSRPRAARADSAIRCMARKWLAFF